MTFQRLIQGDCLEVLPTLEDESVDLILTDPPYGIIKDMPLGKGGGVAKSINYLPCDWDNKHLSKEQTKELFRISKNQIIFGANHFSNLLPMSSGWMVWDKRKMGTPCDYADCELIYTSFDVVSRIFYHRWRGFIRDSEKNTQRVHPTQKPIALMKWLLKKFSNEGDVICDPFLGSGTTMLACRDLGRNCIGIEISPEYCEIARKRVFHRTLDNSITYSFEVFGEEKQVEIVN